MKRFIITPPEDYQRRVLLDRDESRHLARVLRLTVGEEIEMIDGTGSLFHGRIDSLGKEVGVHLIGRKKPVPETAGSLWVCQAELKGKKMDEVVEKCTELGVSRFVPFVSGRSQGRLSAERKRHRLERWQQIVRSACKQSGRLRFMQVDDEQEFVDLLARKPLTNQAERILFWEEENNRSLADLRWRGMEKSICLILGPEGGFSREEVDEAKQYGWQVVSLGTGILRAETATIAAVSIVQHLRGII